MNTVLLAEENHISLAFIIYMFRDCFSCLSSLFDIRKLFFSPNVREQCGDRDILSAYIKKILSLISDILKPYTIIGFVSYCFLCITFKGTQEYEK